MYDINKFLRIEIVLKDTYTQYIYSIFEYNLHLLGGGGGGDEKGED